MSNSPQHQERRRRRARLKAKLGRALPGVRSSATVENDAFRRAMERLTGPERARWARANRPGHRDRDPAALRPFTRRYA